jgi:hypothetical protein
MSLQVYRSLSTCPLPYVRGLVGSMGIFHPSSDGTLGRCSIEHLAFRTLNALFDDEQV